MGRNESKAKSATARRALRDLSNNAGGNFSKSITMSKKKPFSTHKQIIHKQHQHQQHDKEEDEYLDRLLLVQSDLSSLTRQIDELVALAFKQKPVSKQGRKEIESFSFVLSDIISSLKPWVPRFQMALSKSSFTDPDTTDNQKGALCLADATKTVSSVVNDDDKFEVKSPEQTGRISMISPSPLVSWRPDSNFDRGRQLFLLTPLPMSKSFSSKRFDVLSKSCLFQGVSDHPAVELPSSLLTFSEDVNDDLLEGIATKPTPKKASDSVVTEAKEALDSQSVSSPPHVFTKRDDHSMLIMTPCMKMSPPKSCVLLEPLSESAHKTKFIARKATPFPAGILSQISESSSESDSSEDLALKYPELLGIQRACKSKIGNKELDSSPNWSFSPPKTCVLLEPPDEKLQDTLDLNQQAKLSSLKPDDRQGGCSQIQKPCNQGNSLALVESTPMWKEPQSTIRRGKQPGENTLKKELWTRFEAASTYGVRLNVTALQRTAQKGFLDMLDEVSCDGESPVANSLR